MQWNAMQCNAMQCMYVCMYVYIYIYVYTHTYTPNGSTYPDESVSCWVNKHWTYSELIQTWHKDMEKPPFIDPFHHFSVFSTNIKINTVVVPKKTEKRNPTKNCDRGTLLSFRGFKILRH